MNTKVRLALVLVVTLAPIRARAELGETMSEPAWDDRSYHFGLNERELAVSPVANWCFDDIGPTGLPQSWDVENHGYVRIVGDALEGERAIGLRCDAQGRGRISQSIDVSELGGQKLFIRYRAKVKGSVVPHFVVELADGSTVEVPAAGGREGTAVLAELHKYGWYPYDGHYGWLFWNDHLPVLYRDSWQTLGGIFTVPARARAVRVTFEPRPARYNALERRKALVASGEAVIDSVQIGRTKRQLLTDAVAKATEEWEGATYGADEFFYLSYVYNQSMIAKASLDMRLWEVLRAVHYAERRGVPSAAIVAQLRQTQRKLDECYVQLAGLRRFYEAQCSSFATQLDFSELQREYPVGHAGPVGTTPAARPDYYLSLHIEKLVRDGFARSSQLTSALQSDLTAIGQDLGRTASRLREAVGERPEGKLSFPDRDLAYGEISLSKTAGTSPFFFATGNTGFPYRVYRDLGVDVISINYYSSELIDEEGRIAVHPSIARMLREQGQKQYNAMFFPAHYHFAVPNSFIAKHKDELADMLRIDKNGNSPIRLRDRKFGRHSRTKFEYDPSYTYYLPISIMHPKGRTLLGQRLRGIGEHIARAETRDTLIRLELGAENVNLLAPAHDEWTKRAFGEYVAGKFGTVEKANRLLQTDFADLDDIRYWDNAGHTDREKVKVERLKTEFMAIHNAQFYEEAIEQLSASAPDLPVSNREDCLWFRDYSYLYAQKTTDLIDYHALYDRAYGYYLGRCVGKDHVTGEDLITGQSGLKTRDTIEQAFSKLLIVGWRQAS